ncbi:MAG: tryptophan-rich sensory protein [Polyangiaceae bacterium]|nr:tryptophan-rich sensory protein [Polyangiaceae bacterium]MCE7889191.1 tryptophan-rich sensory protein [Sorangiineae bacterium PRO1]MCL4750221.1 tryptophan-rich sensory protein [Myxococcales bacterium]
MSAHGASPTRSTSTAGTLRLALAAIAPVLAAAVLGSIATRPNITGWYAQLEKPWFNPPNWLFGPVWTALYVAMAYSFWRVLRTPRDARGRSRAIGVFFAQMTLNAAWSWVFFWAHSPRAALVVIVLLWICIAATAAAFWRVDKIAGWLFVPYLAWVSYATALNAALAALNPSA